MGNIKKYVGGKQIGDEDRLKYEIRKIDFLKFGHHGYSISNTIEYIAVISPDYGVITNDINIQVLMLLDIWKIIRKKFFIFNTR